MSGGPETVTREYSFRIQEQMITGQPSRKREGQRPMTSRNRTLIKDFMNAANGVDETDVKWRIAIHLTFVVSGLAFAIMDWVADLNKRPKSK
jgi:hypothetical protein